MSPATAGSVPVLVDSSLWVEHLRKGGDPVKRERVNGLLLSGAAAWCPAVRLELWRGVTNDAERAALRRFEALLPDYEITPAVWHRAVTLADRGRAAGLSVPLADLVIFACAVVHGLAIAHDDAHFDALARLQA
jgi:predicted nucleic acid-binding protein